MHGFSPPNLLNVFVLGKKTLQALSLGVSAKWSFLNWKAQQRIKPVLALEAPKSGTDGISHTERSSQLHVEMSCWM